MAQPDILLDLEQLQEIAIAATETSMTTIDDQMENACSIVGTLTVVGWRGEASDRFLASFTEYKTQMKSLYENLEMLQAELTAISDQGEIVFANGNKLLNTL